MNENPRQFLDDAFSAFSMLANHNFVAIYDTRERVTRYSHGAVQMFGLPGEYVPDGCYSWVEHIHPEDRHLYRKTMQELLDGAVLNYDLTYRCKIWDGSYAIFRFLGASIRDKTGTNALIGGLIINEGRLEFTDSNTLISNKDSFFKDLATLQASHQKSAILLLGINELAAINKEFNYSYGNHVLQQVAWLIQEQVGSKGVVYRMEGRRFAIMSRTLTEVGMRALYAAIQQQLRIGVTLDESRQTLSTSGGLFMVNDSSLSGYVIYDCLQSVYKDSRFTQDGALVSYNTRNTDEANQNLALIEHLRHSMINDCDNFSFEYQPIVDRKTETIVGLEALLRWKGKEGEKESAAPNMQVLVQDFAFEEFGIWILRQTMLEGKTILAKNPHLFLNVNIALSQLRDICFQESVLELLNQTEFPAKNLSLELSDKCRRLPITTLRERIKKLQEKGVRLTLDDFGTGTKNLECLQALSIDLIKFDTRILRYCLESELGKEDLTLLSKLASSHKTKVCIKCIENESIQKVVEEIPFDYAQGFAYGRPLPLAALLKILA